MNNTTKIIGGIIIILIIVLLVVFYKPAPKETVKIGVILPLSGKAATYGQDIEAGLEIAKEEINRTSEKIELVYQDSQCDPTKAVSAYRFLHDVENTKVIIGAFCSSSTLAIAPSAEEDKVILITPGSSAATITEAGDFIFRNHTRGKLEMEKTVAYARSKYKKLAIIHDKTNDALVLNRDFFVEEFKSQGGEILVDLSIIGGGGDYKTELSKIKSKINEIEAVVIIVLGGDGVVLVKQMNELGIKKDLLGDKGFATTDFVESVGKELVEGIVYAEARYDKDINLEFWEKYLEKTNKVPASWSAQGYDTLMILTELIFNKKCGTDTICIRDELYKVKNYPGVAGNTTFDENGDVIKEIILKTIKNGQFVPYEE